ncbi:MAG: ABC transporter ATP-binding protein [SAR202 cluster bacterium]|nr:ABC transporter ATP-binding protein [SAR202 cluster bacterium]
MLKVENLEMEYSTDRGPVRAVRGVSFEVPAGHFFTLLGPSGCGKTTTMRCIAGLETPKKGKITIGSDVVYDSAARVVVPTHKRAVGMVFQSYAIWPHMSVYDNVSFPLLHGRNKIDKREAKERAMRALTLVQLDQLAQRPAPQLSGGQQQRVALARAIAYEPNLLLLDEPLSNLDAKLRDEMRAELKELVGRMHITTLYVTHDQVEALSMSDSVAVMHDGLIEQEGPPRDIYLRPTSMFAANFVGKMNILTGIVKAHEANGNSTVETAFGQLAVKLPEWASRSQRVLVVFRPETATLRIANGARPLGSIRLPLIASSFVGDSVEYMLDAGGKTIRVKGDPFTQLPDRCEVDLVVPPERCLIMQADQAPEAEASSAPV